MTAGIDAWIGCVMIDTTDPERLVPFWSALLGVGRAADPSPPEFVALERPPGGGVALAFQRVPEPKAGKNRVHVDVVVDDVDAATALVESLGGRQRPGGDFTAEPRHGWRWRQMADPDGNEFCLVPRSPAAAAGDEPGG